MKDNCKKVNSVVSFIFDHLLWYILYMLPIIVYLFNPGEGSIDSVINSFGFLVNVNNPIYIALDGLFGLRGVMPLFVRTAPLHFVSWFVSMFLLHLAVDFVLFIPRLAHKWMGEIYGLED